MIKPIIIVFALLSTFIFTNGALAEKCHLCDFSDEAIEVKPGQAELPRPNKKLAAPRPGAANFAVLPQQAKDTYCHDTKPGYPPCDDDFEKKCSGSMSGLQGWGGKTCFTTSGGRATE